MQWRIDRGYLAWAAALFLLLVLLATAGARLGWLRSFFGDVLAVAWLYTVFRAVLAAPVRRLALAAFGVGVLLEGAQWLVAAMHWRIASPVLRIVLGATADPWDVLAYALGALSVLVLEALRGRRRHALA